MKRFLWKASPLTIMTIAAASGLQYVWENEVSYSSRMLRQSRNIASTVADLQKYRQAHGPLPTIAQQTAGEAPETQYGRAVWKRTYRLMRGEQESEVVMVSFGSNGRLGGSKAK